MLLLADLLLNNILTKIQIKAIKELKNLLNKTYQLHDLAIFGSVARQEAAEESDLDVLILIQDKVTHMIRNNISDMVFDINLKYGTNISIIVLEQNQWETGMIKITPFYDEIQKDGVFINEYF